MKIILTENEVQQLKSLSRILGREVSRNDISIATTTTVENGLEVVVAEELVNDGLGVLMTMAPVAKGLYAQLKASFTLLRMVLEEFEIKWAKKPEQNKEVA